MSNIKINNRLPMKKTSRSRPKYISENLIKTIRKNINTSETRPYILDEKKKLKRSKKFITGLTKYKITSREINNWYYSGGNYGKHLKYFKSKYPDEDLPDLHYECVCGQPIKNNCYITDGKEIIVLGTTCIKKFIKKKCKKCKIEIEPNYKICYECYRNRKY